MPIITANDIKTHGVQAISDATEDGEEAFISVRGKTKYVVLPIDKYNYLRECELEAALAEAKGDLEKGKYIDESVDAHMRRIKNA